MPSYISSLSSSPAFNSTSQREYGITSRIEAILAKSSRSFLRESTFRKQHFFLSPTCLTSTSFGFYFIYLNERISCGSNQLRTRQRINFRQSRIHSVESGVLSRRYLFRRCLGAPAPRICQARYSGYVQQLSRSSDTSKRIATFETQECRCCLLCSAYNWD